MGKPRKVEKPEKELRFTRARQALVFLGLGIVLLCTSFFLLLAAYPIFTGVANETLSNSPWWALVPLPFAAFFFWIGTNMSRHAFLLLTPIGIEIFPFWFPRKNLNIITWSEVDSAEVTDDHKMLIVTLAGAEDAKVFISLDPIPVGRRPLLAQALEGRMAERARGSSRPGQDPDPPS